MSDLRAGKDNENRGNDGSANRKGRRIGAVVIDVLVIMLVAGFMFVALGPEHSGETPVKDYLLERASDETGAPNLVTAIYLGYRAFDTLGETIVLLLAVSGIAVFLERRI